MDDWRAAWGSRLRRARKDVPLTQQELAYLLKVAQTTVSAWERGAAIPRDDLRPKIAHVVRCPVSVLFDYPTTDDTDANGNENQAVA
jgi:transcriptional regulator with XRE-family HTH domain